MNTFSSIRAHIQSREAKLSALQQTLVEKHALAMQLPFALDVVHVVDKPTEQPGFSFVRLHDAKKQGVSLKKGQCDLWELCWGSSLLLAHVMRGVNCDAVKTLEIGGGLGVATLAVATKWETQSSLMTDLVEDALAIFKISTCIQRVRARDIRACRLDFNHPEVLQGERFDIVFGSDVLFMGWCAKPVARLVNAALSETSGMVIIVDPYRLNDQVFFDELHELGIRYQQSFHFSQDLLKRILDPILDVNGSVIRVPGAKLLVASRLPFDEELFANLVKA